MKAKTESDYVAKHPRSWPVDPRDRTHLVICQTRTAVCRRCHCFMPDCEPHTLLGEFWHPTKTKAGKMHPCKNAGLYFNTSSPEVEPFMRKARRRFLKRAGIRA